jgi:hypothetical protein
LPARKAQLEVGKPAMLAEDYPGVVTSVALELWVKAPGIRERKLSVSGTMRAPAEAEVEAR